MDGKHAARSAGRIAPIAALLLALGVAACATTQPAQPLLADAPSPGAERPWTNASLSPDERAALLIAQMTREEKLTLVVGYFASLLGEYRPPEGVRMGSAGYIPGIERLGVPALWETDAGVGVATQGAAPEKRERTALPSGLALAASWNPDVAFQGGAMIGDEARRSGFNVMLAGGVNLLREPRNGRNFEYGGEDPLLAGTIVGATVRGIQSNHIISTVKHFALNDQETGRFIANVVIEPDQARVSDLLAFQIALEQSNAGSVMCAYNRVNGTYACENQFLLSEVLRRDWGFKGFVMSDWGAVHSTEQAANSGLDQESGSVFDEKVFFGEPLREAVQAGRVPEARLDEMVRRILRPMFEHGLFDHPVEIAPIDFDAHARVTQSAAEQTMVLLKNRNNLLPLSPDVRKIAVIGGHADAGVLSGGGSSQVYPAGGNAVPGLEPRTWPGPVVYYPSSPLAAIRARAPNADVQFADGADRDAAVRLARQSNVAIVFATQWTTESLDASLTLTDDQDGLIAAVARANPRTIVVLETGGPVFMPWLARTAAVLEAWYPGTRGGEAIANVLFGAVNPSGRLPVTFPRTLAQLPRPELDGVGLPARQPFDVHYREGAAVGYKWFEARNLEPLFPFGFGLSYTRFEHSALSANVDGGDLVVRFHTRNAGARAGADVAQIYVSPVEGGWEAPKRLGGWSRIELAPGAEKDVAVRVDPRLLATYDAAHRVWRIAPGRYRVQLGASSRDIRASVVVELPERTLPLAFVAPRTEPPEH
jgi:beta-glucosidase